jgi:hypothetical protein
MYHFMLLLCGLLLGKGVGSRIYFPTTTSEARLFTDNRASVIYRQPSFGYLPTTELRLFSDYRTPVGPN